MGRVWIPLLLPSGTFLRDSLCTDALLRTVPRRTDSAHRPQSARVARRGPFLPGARSIWGSFGAQSAGARLTVRGLDLPGNGETYKLVKEQRAALLENEPRRMIEQTHAWMYERAGQVKVIAESELELRRRGFDESTRVALTQAQEGLTQWARSLELSLLLASAQEAVTRLGLPTNADVVRESDRVDALVRTLSRLDPLRVIEENAGVLAPLLRLPIPAEGPACADLGLVVRAVQSLLLHCPITALERAGNDHALPDLAHRCRLAFDGLRAFVARNSHPQADAMLAAGRAYAEGRLSIDEVAAVLGVVVSDAVALLQEQGFHRSVEDLRLSEEGLREKLRAIREERRARDGEPNARPELVARDVIASQRIEDIDARPWLRT